MQERLLGFAGVGLQVVLAAATLSHGICKERCNEETKNGLRRLSEVSSEKSCLTDKKRLL